MGCSGRVPHPLQGGKDKIEVVYINQSSEDSIICRLQCVAVSVTVCGNVGCSMWQRQLQCVAVRIHGSIL